MRIGRLVMRVVAVAALVLGIVVMHHVVRSDHETSATAATERVVEHGMSLDVASAVDGRSDDSAMGDEALSNVQGLLHLCLAVLIAAVLMLAGWLLLARREWPTAWRSWLVQVWRTPARPPPRPHGSALLVSLCVMRT